MKASLLPAADLSVEEKAALGAAGGRYPGSLQQLLLAGPGGGLLLKAAQLRAAAEGLLQHSGAALLEDLAALLAPLPFNLSTPGPMHILAAANDPTAPTVFSQSIAAKCDTPRCHNLPTPGACVEFQDLGVEPLNASLPGRALLPLLL